jgi:hypothetical protein
VNPSPESTQKKSVPDRQHDVIVPLREDLKTDATVQATPKRDWHNKQNWRQNLRVGMSKTEVQNLFGEPPEMSVSGNMEFWRYGDGTITFVVDKDHAIGSLFSWREPD